MSDQGVTDGGIDSGQSDATYQLTYEIATSESPSEATVRAVAALKDTALLDLDPLYHSIDPDHLDSTIERADATADSPELSFTYNGCAVTVTRSEITVRSNEGGTERS